MQPVDGPQMNFQLTHDLAPFAFGFAAITWLFVAILHLAIGLRIWANAIDIGTARFPPNIAPWIWGFSAVIGGIFVAGLYWLIYYSALQRVDVRVSDPAEDRVVFSVWPWIWTLSARIFAVIAISAAVLIVIAYVMTLLSKRP